MLALGVGLTAVSESSDVECLSSGAEAAAPTNEQARPSARTSSGLEPSRLGGDVFGELRSEVAERHHT
jgi:hypothetical protein